MIFFFESDFLVLVWKIASDELVTRKLVTK